MESDNKSGFVKRKFFLIYPEFQIRFLGHLFMIGSFSVGVVLAMFYFVYKYMVNIGVQAGIPLTDYYFEMVQNIQSILTILCLIGGLIIFGVVMALGLVLSHRIAGPLIRMKSQLECMIDKDHCALVSFRKNDYFQDIARDIALLTEKTNAKEKSKAG